MDRPRPSCFVAENAVTTTRRTRRRGRPPPERVTATPEQLRALAARQFRLPPTPDRSSGPSVVVFDSTPAFARSTDALIDMPANYTTDMHLANQAAIYQAWLAGFRGGSRRRR